MRVGVLCAAVAAITISACDLVHDPVGKIDNSAVYTFANACVNPLSVTPATPVTPLLHASTYATAGYAYVEQQCGVFFDNLAEVTQAGRFGDRALTAGSLGATAILQAAKAAAQSVVIVAASATLTQAVFDSFVEQYAFAPYLYKLKDLTTQAFNQDTKENTSQIATLADTPDGYCAAYILIQKHASICTISYLQMQFDSQIAKNNPVGPPKATPPGGAPPGRASAVEFRRGGVITPSAAPNYIVR
jgi:hypothetical protein